MFNFENVVYYGDPWPHLIIEDFITDSNTLDVLCNNVELKYVMSGFIEPAGRIDIEESELQSYPNCPKEIVNTIFELRQSKQLISLLEYCFLDHLLELYPNKTKQYFTNLIDIRATYGCNNTCINKTDLKGIHLDSGKKIYTGMIYLKEYNDNTTGSNIVLQSYDNDGNILNEKEINYESNIALFWPTTHNAWHYVQPRNPSPENLRRFINFVADGTDYLHDYTNLNSNNVKQYEWKKVNINT